MKICLIVISTLAGICLGIAWERHDRYLKLCRGLDRIAGVVRQQEQEERRCRRN